MTDTIISIKTPEEIALIKEGGRILGRILGQLAKMAKPGVTTGDLETEADRLIATAHGLGSFRGYHTRGEIPYPTILCTSINDEVVHATALPPRPLKNGDIIGIDIGMEYPNPECRRSRPEFIGLRQGFYTDTAVTVMVGKVTPEARQLTEITQGALFAGLRVIKPGRKISDIGRAIEDFIKKQKVRIGIVRDLVGHGVGYSVHEAPRIPNYFDPALSKVEIKAGMVLAIEPMLTLGDWRVVTGPDGFAIKTADGSLSAHFEHTVVVTKTGCDIVTKN